LICATEEICERTAKGQKCEILAWSRKLPDCP
jgi:hypothetical protein